MRQTKYAMVLSVEERARNRATRTIDRRVTADDAWIKLRRLYPTIDA